MYEKVKYYTPVVQEGDGDCFVVSGSCLPDKAESIRITKQHVAFKNPQTEIIRIDEDYRWNDDN